MFVYSTHILQSIKNYKKKDVFNILENQEKVYAEVAKKHIELVQEEYKVFIDLLGIDSFIKFIYYFGGSQVYFPTYKSVFKNCIRKEIIKEYDGRNIFSLCVKYGLSERVIRDWVTKGVEANV